MQAENVEMKYYTYADYLTFDDDIRCELIDGVIYNMSSPTNAHFFIVSRLWKKFDTFLDGRRCKAFFAPVDVRLNADKRDDTVVQPDVFVICDEDKYDKKGRGIKGAPDFVAEVLSPSTAYNDRVLKRDKYEEAGVPEYWIIDTEHKTMEVCVLYDGKYFSRNYGGSDLVPVHSLPGLEINLGEIFED
jgi:Uma2 family endonuclease